MKRRDLLSFGLILAAAPTVAQASGPSGGSTSQARFTTLGVLTATLVRSGGRRGVLTVEAGIDVENEALRASVAQSVPRLRAAFSQVVRTFGAAMLPGEVPDADRLARDLQAATNETLGRQGARLLIGTILTR
ncbi:hypothetical protein [Brevundimonas aveniformis]|uniref:hypothetical protein n=1 Tax=Brevundimonas aveniformis TaxID=370977 RepID=UPI000403C392|nr:hypothetical protein [Brevundimonas aveniformis]